MKLIHTADWHIGQTFFEYNREAEHLLFLEWLKEQIRENSADLLLISGDVFDSPNPSAESQKIFYRFLKGVTSENSSLQVIVIAGNHDSAGRLEAPNPLLEEMNVTVRGIVRRTVDGTIDLEHLIIPLAKGGYCLAVPYLRQGDYPEAENYARGVETLYRKLYEKVEGRGEPVIAMGHLQATGSEISENDRSERTVIGGLECVSPDSFVSGIAYTALGHLHRNQRVSGRDNIRYSGAPLPMSFAEKNNRQGVTLVELTDTAVIRRLEFDTPVKLLSIPQNALPLDRVLKEIETLPDGGITPFSPYLEVKILLTEPEPSLRYRIEEALKSKSVRLARISAVVHGKDERFQPMAVEEVHAISPMDLAEDVFRKRFGNEIPESMRSLLKSVIQEVEK